MIRTYFPRNDFVILKTVDRDTSEGGVVLPDISREKKKWLVHAIGPKVEALSVGDEVQVMGTVGLDIALIVNEKGMFITKEENVIIVVKENE